MSGASGPVSVMESRAPSGPGYAEDEKNRLWAHRLHEDVMLYQRHSFVLVTQSLLLVACAQLLSSHRRFDACALATVGLLVTAAWLVVNRRQRQLIAYVQDRALRYLPEFADTYQARPRGGPGLEVIVAVWIPLLLGAIWLVLLVAAIH
jgi:hypothetical protein